jgi:hypothetical protein
MLVILPPPLPVARDTPAKVKPARSAALRESDESKGLSEVQLQRAQALRLRSRFSCMAWMTITAPRSSSAVWSGTVGSSLRP